MKKSVYSLITVIGLAFAAVGLWYVKSAGEAQGVMRVLPYLSIGLGCGAFGHGLGELISFRALQKSPELQKQMEIDKKDERNIMISNQAKGKAYDAMIYIFGALIFSLALMGLEMYVVLLLVFAYLLVVAISIYYRCKYDKAM